MAITTLLFLAAQSQPTYMPAVQAWTFNRFTVFEAIEKTAASGGKFIELFPGQKLAPDTEAKLGPDMSYDQNYRLKQYLKLKGVRWVAYGVTGISRNEVDARKLFSWARSHGVEILNTESTDAIDVVDQLSKEFGMKVGYHNHPKQPNNPNYKVWDPAYVYELVKNRNPLVGACADTGHWVRSGIKPVDAIRALKGRIVSSHLKDLHEFSPNGHDTVYGTGVSDVKGILAAYRDIQMKGTVSVEYEYDWDDNQPEVAECLKVLSKGF